MGKINILFIMIVFTVPNSVYADDVSVDNFIWPSGGSINLNEFTAVVCEFGTFYTGYRGFETEADALLRKRHTGKERNRNGRRGNYRFHWLSIEAKAYQDIE